MNSGFISGSPGLVLNLPDGLFQWSGGTLDGLITNAGVMSITLSNLVTLGPGQGGSGVQMYNAGLVRQATGSALEIGAANSSLVNLAGGTYDLAGDGISGSF